MMNLPVINLQRIVLYIYYWLTNFINASLEEILNLKGRNGQSPEEGDKNQTKKTKEITKFQTQIP